MVRGDISMVVLKYIVILILMGIAAFVIFSLYDEWRGPR